MPLPAVIEDAGRIVVTQPVAPFGPQGTQWRVMLVARSSLIDERVAASDFHRGFVLVAIVCSVLPLAAGILLIGFFLRAIPKLQEAARAVAAGDLSHRVAIHSGDEMEDLAQDFNYMATRLAEYGQLERAIALEKLKDDLIHMIVHDLRTPLTGILGTLQTIESCDYDVEVTRDLVPGARRASVTLMGLINDLLDINKMEAGAMELDVARVDTTAVVEEAVDMLRPLAEDKGLKLRLLECEGLPPMEADADKLRRIFVNLIGNAIKFTPSGGEVIVRAGGGYDGQALHFMVEDTGEGIPPEYLDRIFEKFGQVETRKAGR
ncbi:MAG TPA: HAMP domain-containing sensor histidine kinase, partial [Armatimonadota bacterium]|nr:HAMP domain-containing sensor histidine kinase [Armatimonadota bacterium]